MAALIFIVIFISGLRITYVSLSNFLSKNNFELFHISLSQSFYIIGMVFGLILIISVIGALRDKGRWKKITYKLVLINFAYFILSFIDVYVNKPPIYKLSLLTISIEMMIGLLVILYIRLNWMKEQV